MHNIYIYIIIIIKICAYINMRLCIYIYIHSQVASYLDMPAPGMVGCFKNQMVLTS